MLQSGARRLWSWQFTQSRAVVSVALARFGRRRLHGRGQRCGHSSGPGAGSVVRERRRPPGPGLRRQLRRLRAPGGTARSGGGRLRSAWRPSLPKPRCCWSATRSLRTLLPCSPRLTWAHHTQAGVSNLAGTDLWDSQVTLTSSRGAVAATAIAEYALAAAAHFARGLHEAASQKAAGQFTRAGLPDAYLARGDDGGHRLGRHRPGGGPAVACGRHAGDRHPPLGHCPAARR